MSREDPRGWESGMLGPGAIYRRIFAEPGAFPDCDGGGHAGTAQVNQAVYLLQAAR